MDEWIQMVTGYGQPGYSPKQANLRDVRELLGIPEIFRDERK